MARDHEEADGELDVLLRDRKKASMEGCSAVVPFLATVLVGLPVWIGLLLPATLLWQLLSFPFRKCCRSKPAAAKELPPLKTDCPAKTREGTLDVIIYGATGFTGSMVAKYLAKNYAGTDVKWGIAGRRRSVLEGLRSEVAAVDPRLADLPIITADSSDMDSLREMCGKTKVVLSTVGPFALYGTPLVQCCAETGTDYCDITGETDWVREMIDRYDDLAHKTGARIVHFCGHDCVPWDLAVQAVAARIQDTHGEALTAVRCYDEIRGSASGGTIATIFASLQGRKKYKATACAGFDPLMKVPAPATPAASPHKCTAANQGFLGYSSERQAWVGPFVMASVMANCTKRSNALEKFGPRDKSLKYYEAQEFPNFAAGFVMIFGLIAFGTALAFPPFRWILRTCVLPKPGQGPSEASMDAGFLRVNVVGQGEKGATAKASFYFPTDPGYRDTARMLSESGLVLALTDANELPRGGGGGVLTPAACQGKKLLERLEVTGSTFTWEC